MARNWWSIAKAEFLILTSKFRSVRKFVTIIMFLFAISWALVIAPKIMLSIVDLFAEEFQLLLAIAFPGLMRSVMLILWILILIYPISYALQEIKIGQWEILLSNNVSTKDMLLGMFLGKIPNYGLLVLFLSPILLSPFIIVYQVSLFGQVLMYAVLFIVALSTLWFSNVLSIAIQAKLGESSRGNDIAKAFSIVVAMVFLIPLYGLMFFSGPLSEIMGLGVFQLLPSTWGADLITWIAIYQNGIGLPLSSIQIFEEILGFSIFIDALLVGVFGLFLILIGLSSADRLFTVEAGARTEVVTTVGKENIVLRGIRRIYSGHFGVLVVTSLKDFGRKAQNVSKVGYSIFLAILLPLIMNYSLTSQLDDPLFLPVMTTLTVSMMLGMIGAIAFGGVGFLESKSQLWIIQGAPNGAYKFILARIVGYTLLGIPIALIPTITVTLILGFDVFAMVYMFINVFLVVFGAILVGIGITANNPAFEDTKSSAFYVNTFTSLLIIMMMLMFGFISSILLIMIDGNVILSMIMGNAPLIIMGALILSIGAKRLEMPGTT
ncbi:MAG: hypothetical protein ACTSQZ_02775 [Candidatus Thorarchaeota archaeon]